MRGSILLGATFVLAACGPPPEDFSGHWSGPISDSSSCRGGPLVVISDNMDFMIRQSGSSITVVRTHCSIDLDVTGDTASLSGTFDCPEASDDAGTWVTHYTAASLTIRGNELSVAFQTHMDNHDYNGDSYTCDATTVGVLHR